MLQKRMAGQPLLVFEDSRPSFRVASDRVKTLGLLSDAWREHVKGLTALHMSPAGMYLAENLGRVSAILGCCLALID